jgi:hypothetical protein
MDPMNHQVQAKMCVIIAVIANSRSIADAIETSAPSFNLKPLLNHTVYRESMRGTRKNPANLCVVASYIFNMKSKGKNATKSHWRRSAV